MTESLINYERTNRTVICLNPNHDTVKFKTNKVGNIHCPTCDALMVVEIKAVIEIECIHGKLMGEYCEECNDN